MPFAYYGAKHRLASRYPAPIGPVVIEPFAGSAAYSMRYIEHLERVILVEADPAVVELWHRVIGMSLEDLDALDTDLELERTTDPLLAASGGSTSLHGTLSGRSRRITPRMRKSWPTVKRRIARALPHLSKVEVIHGSYDSAPDLEATYFVDPPYQPLLEDYSSTCQAGAAYRFGSEALDYDALSEWCRSRRGLVIVCEQEPASWLPFDRLVESQNAQNTRRTEVVWTSSTDR